MKTCTKCGISKDESEYYKKYAECKVCSNLRSKLWAKQHPECAKKRYQNWRKKRRFYEILKSARQYARVSGHLPCNATEEDLECAFNGKCVLCGFEENPDERRLVMFFSVAPKTSLVMDHSHKTGNFRGFLCNHCNSMLGLSGDSPELLRKAALYLEERQ